MKVVVTIYESNCSYEAYNSKDELPFGCFGEGNSLDEVKEDFQDSLKEMIAVTDFNIPFEDIDINWVIKHE